MQKVNSYLLREAILRNAPHRMINPVKSVAYRLPKQPPVHAQLETMKDEAFLDVFTYTNFCEYIPDPHFKIGGFGLRQTQ